MSSSKTSKNRWLIALSAVAIHLSIGSIYAYSVYQNPLRDTLGWEISDVTLGFTVAVFMLGMAAAFLGTTVEKYGPRLSGLAAAVLFGLGTVGAGLSVQLESYPLFLATYGVVGGVGLGIGYISPISTLVEWFPDRRGMATGLAVMGFGAGALVTGPVAAFLMDAISIPMAFYILGAGYFVMMAAGSSYLAKPPSGWTPDGVDESELDSDGEKGSAAATSHRSPPARRCGRPDSTCCGSRCSSTSPPASCSSRWRPI